jgi:tetratricopeptide (TPR) repeat protein
VAEEVVFTPREAVRPPAAEQAAARVARAPSPAAVPTERSADQLPPAQPRPAPTRPEPERRDSIAARMRAKRRRPRKLGAALKRLDRELKERRPASMPQRRPSVAQPEASARNDKPAAHASGAAAKKKADRAHVKALMRMRQAQKTSALHSGKVVPHAPGKSADGGVTFSQAERALRDQRFGKAHDILKQLVKEDPDNELNELHQTYMYWAAFRAKRASEDDKKELRKQLRTLASDELHRGFAAYALGHLALDEKREDQAEKYFRKAIELDRNNRDAERHLRILELKKKTAESERNNKIFGIEISRKKG